MSDRTQSLRNELVLTDEQIEAAALALWKDEGGDEGTSVATGWLGCGDWCRNAWREKARKALEAAERARA